MVKAQGYVLAITAALFAATTLAHADDDGGGGGGSEGSGGGGSDPWRPNYKKSQSPQKCSCFFGLCSCGSKPKAATKARAAPPKPVAERPRAEILVVGLNDQALARLVAQGYASLGQRTSELIGGRIDRLLAPRRQSASAALAQVRRQVPQSRTVVNSSFTRMREQVYRPAGISCGAQCDHFSLTDWSPEIGQCAQSIRIGVVDTRVDLAHPALHAGKITTHSIHRTDKSQSDSGHGTGVVSLLSGQSASLVLGLARTAEVFAVDAFHRPTGSESDRADAYDLIAALDWLAGQQAQVINLSLAGEDNDLVKTAVETIVKRSIIVVAAAGLPGTSKSTGYPARYPGVVAVAGVDTRLRPSALSARGSHISIAAPATGIVVANGSKSLHRVDGTSFAAPFVTAAYSLALAQTRDPQKAHDVVTAATKDLGPPGRDELYGHGIVQYSKLPRCAAR